MNKKIRRTLKKGGSIQQMSPMTAYRTLNLEEGSSLSTIKKAYRTLALKNHPDRKGSTSVMQKINSAYETLKKIGSTRKRTPTRYKTPSPKTSPKESPKAPPKTSPKAKKGENAWWDNHISNREKAIEELFKETKEGNKKKVEEIIKNFNRNTGDNLEGSQDDNGYSPLFYAAEKGHIEIVKYLVELGVSIDAAGYATQKSPLGIAVYNGDIEIVKYLVEKGANIDKKDHMGNTILSKSLLLPVECKDKKKKMEILKYLIDKGADIKESNDTGETLIHIAAKAENLDGIDYLLKKGLKIEERNYKEQTPLHYAAYWGKLSGVKHLVAKGADINAGDRLGKRALDIARNRKHSEVIGYLERLSGGKSNKRRTRKLRKHLK